MFIDKNSLQVKVGSGSYINLGDYITEARYGYNKIWGDDSGRNLKGSMSGSLVGIFVKVIVNFRRLTRSELQTIAPILDASRQTLKYYDPTKAATVEMETYTGDYEVTNNHIIDTKRKNESFEVSFIAVNRRT